MSYPIFIDSLPRNFTSADLATLFRPFGHVIAARVMYDSSGQSLGYGCAEMETEASANDACKHLNGSVLQNATLIVLRAPGVETSPFHLTSWVA
jgi:RNA recognition motif-containing protein